MKYLYNPVTGALDDVETPKLGEKYFASAETDEIIKQINDQFGPGTMFPASDAPQPENPYKDFEDRNPAANGGMMRQNFVVPGLIFAPQAITAMAAVTGLGIEAVRRYAQENPDMAENLLNNLKTNSANLKDTVLAFVDGVTQPKSKEMEDLEKLGQKETFPVQEDYSASFGGTGTEIPEQTKEEPPVSGGTIDIPLTTGGQEIPETKKEDLIFTNQEEGTGGRYLGKKTVIEPKEETIKEIKEIADAYRLTKTKKGAKQPIMKDYEKLELINLVMGKFEELEGRVPSGTDMKKLPGTKQIDKLFEIIRDNKIELGSVKADYNRMDPEYITTMENNFQKRAIEQDTITNFGNKSFYPDTVTLKDGTEVNAQEFFEKNLAEKINFGPGRKDNPALQNKALAELYNTNVRKIEKTIALLKKDSNFKADYPPPRDVSYARLNTERIIKEARKYLKPSELKNVRIQENEINKLNTKFKNGTLIVTDYPKIVKSMNTTVDKKTGMLDHSIKKTQKEMIERSKKNTGLFNVSHTIGKSTEQKNIEFLRNRNLADYKTNQGLYKSFDAYVKNEIDDPEYDLRLEEFDNYIKEIRQRVKIGNKFFGVDEAMIDSETGEFVGMNRQLEYYGLPKFENGVSLKKIKKAAGGVIPDQEIMNYANGGRINYENGSPKPQLDGNDFLNELEFKFNNIDSVTLDDTPITYDDSKSKIAQVADLADPRNIPYYADMAGQAALRVGEFGARVLPATGNLISDILQKPMFKTPSSYERTENYANMVDDTEVPGETQQGAKFVGGPIFKNFLKNITPTSTEKLVGLDTLINEEKKKMIARGSSSLPVKVAETASLGAELVAPIFPGLKILRAYASAKGVKPTKEVAKTMEKEIDQMAASRGMNRREFLVATGAVGTLGIAKLLGISSELPKIARTAEAVTSVAKTADGVPQYLYNLRNVIRLRGQLQPSSSAFLDGQEVYTYKGVTLYHNTYPKDGSFRIAKEFETDSIVPGEPSYNKVEMEVSKGEDIVVDEGFETQKVVKAGDEYEEATAFPAREGGEDVNFYVEDDFHKQLEEISKELDEINQKVEMFGFDQ